MASAFANYEEDNVDDQSSDEQEDDEANASARLLHLASTAVDGGKVFQSSTLKPARVDSNLFVSDLWVKGFIQKIPVFTDGELQSFHTFLLMEYGAMWQRFAPTDAAGIPDRMVRKLMIIDKLMLLLSKEACQDSRLDKLHHIVQLSPIHGESTAAKIGRSLLLGRDFKIGDPLTFNLVMREAQRSHRSWPKGGSTAKGTKGISEAFSIIGIGPSLNARAWNVRIGRFRGFEDTDPTNPWPWKVGDKVGQRETDGLYYWEMVFTEDRLSSHVKRGRNFQHGPVGGPDPNRPKKTDKKKEAKAWKGRPSFKK